MKNYATWTPEQRAVVAEAYRALAARIVWPTGHPFDPQADLIRKARELERGESLHVHDAGRA